MTEKIVFALRRRYHCEKTRSVLRQNGLSYPVYEIDEQDTSYEDLKQIIGPEARILITGDVYASAMMKQLDIAVVTIRRSKIPFTDSIRQALRLYDRAALLWRENDSPAAQRACRKLGDAVSFFSLPRNKADIDALFRDLKQQGFRVVVGVGALEPFADKYGMEIIFVPYDEDDILSAVRLAEHNLRYIDELRQSAEMLKSVQDNISEGIISLNGDGEIKTINQAAAQILQLDPRTLTGLSLGRTGLACDEINELLHTFEAFDSKVLTVKGTSVAMDGRPVFVHHVFKSAILTLTPVEQLRRSEQLVRTRLNAQASGASVSFQDIVGNSTPIIHAIRTAQQYARVDSSVLVYGQSGTGKEMFVQSIHNASARKNGPFVVINCAALPESLLESELFGYVKGAFTGALSSGKQGLFERGHQGTVFLDEVSEMPLHAQARFLRVLQEREVTPIGGQQPISIDIRVIAATNRDLMEMVQEKKFREDLYYRISVLTMQLPPLCDRSEDVELLIRHFVKTKNQTLKLNIKTISPDAIAYLKSQPYPGNIRQLSNVVERAMVLCEADVLDLKAAVEAITAQGASSAEKSELCSEDAAINALRGESIRQALLRNSGSRSKAAKDLGISCSTLYRRMRSLDIHDIKGDTSK